jgi:hypothetical protein
MAARVRYREDVSLNTNAKLSETVNTPIMVTYHSTTHTHTHTHEGVSESSRPGRLERELQMIQLSATRCNCIVILWVSLVNFAAITLCVASEQVFIVVNVCDVINSVRKLLDTPSYMCVCAHTHTRSESFSNYFVRLWRVFSYSPGRIQTARIFWIIIWMKYSDNLKKLPIPMATCILGVRVRIPIRAWTFAFLCVVLWRKKSCSSDWVTGEERDIGTVESFATPLRNGY